VTVREPSVNELLAVLLARDFRPTDRTIMIGANMPMARAAAVMAALTTHPDTRVVIGLGIQGLGHGAPPPPVHPFLFDPRTLPAEAVTHQGRVFDDLHWPEVFFYGGLQVDRRGNLNLLGIPDGEGGWKVRGPGPLAQSTFSTTAGGYYVVMPVHSPRTFVERVALISALGDVDERRRLGLPGGGVRLILSPLGVFDLGEDGDMRVRSLHPGVTADAVRDATGFELPVPAGVPVTPAPTEDELRVLRERVDVHGTLA